MPAVKHMKWWGWGVEGVSFHSRGQARASRPFVSRAVGIDLTQPPAPPRRSRTSTSPPRSIGDELRGRADRRRRRRRTSPTTTSTGSCTPTARACATSSGSAPATSRACPTSSSTPADEDEVRALVDLAVEADARAHPLRRRQQHLRQPAPARRGDAHRRLRRPRPAWTRCSRSTRTRASPGSRPACSARTSRTQLGRARLDAWATSPTASPTARSAAGSRPARRACSPTSTATSPTSPAGMRVVQPGGTLVVRARAQHLDRTEHPRDDPRLRGSPRRHHRGHRPGAPHPREPRDPGLPVPELGGGPRRHAGDLDQRRAPVGDPGHRRERDRRSPSPPARSPRASRCPRPSAPSCSSSSERRGWDLDQACLCFIGYEGGHAHVAHEKGIVGDDRQGARRHRARQGPGRALRPEEVRHPVHPRLPARPRRRGGRVRDRGAVVEAAAALQRGRRERPQGRTPTSA